MFCYYYFMNFADYQQKALTTDLSGATHPITSTHFFNKLLGLVGETGEIAEKFKKIYRDKNGEFDAQSKAEMEKELGDVLWYLSVVCSYLDISLDAVATQNIEKLISRKTRGQLRGTGDNR